MNKFAEHLKKYMGKKATVGYCAEPENMEEELAIDLAQELMIAANTALEKEGLLWGGYSGEEERKQRVEVQKKAIEPLLNGRLKESIQGKIINLIKEHLTDLNYHTLVSAIVEVMNEKKASKCASRMDWEFPGWETETIEDKIEWLYTHNKNYNNTQYDNIWKLRETLKGSFVDYDEKGEKVYLNKEDIEDILYYLKHHNKNYHGDQYWIIDSLKVEDFLGKLKQATKRAKVTKKAKGIYDLSAKNAMENENFFTDYLRDNIYWFKLSSTSSNNGKKPYEWDVIFNPSDDLLTDKKFTINENNKDYEIKYYSDEPNGSFLMITFHDINLPILNKVVKYVNRDLPELIEKKKGNKVAKVTKKADKIQDRQFKEIYLNLINHKTPLKDYRTLLDNMSYEERMAYYKWLKDNNHAIDEMEMVNFLQTLDNTHGINANKKGKKVNKLANIIHKEINKSAENTGKYGVEYRNMHNAIHGILITDTEEKAKAILEYLKELEDETDETEIEFAWININSLATDTMEEVDYRETEKSGGNYKGIKIINYDEIKPDVYGI